MVLSLDHHRVLVELADIVADPQQITMHRI